jgi:hypothetical protein
MARFCVVVFLALVLQVHLAIAQTDSSSDPEALKLAAQSVAALTQGIPVVDVKLSATVTSIAGPDNFKGSAILQAKGTVESRVDLILDSGNRSDVRSSSNGIPQGAWTDNGQVKPAALHNCWTDAAWFFPALSSLVQTSNPNFVFSYLGQEEHGKLAVLHLRINQISPKDLPDLVHLTTTDFYLDPTSLVPLAIGFNLHPDSDGNTDIPSEIRFADYKSVNGVQVPFHIQRVINGGVDQDIVVNNAVLNSGLPDTSFSLQ